MLRIALISFASLLFAGLGAFERTQTAISQWLVAGPLPAPTAPAVLLTSEPLGAWTALAPTADAAWKAGAAQGTWRRVDGARPALDGAHVAVAYIHAAAAMKALLVVDASAGVRVLLGGKTRVLEPAGGHRESEEDLPAGWNTLVVLAEGPFTVRLADSDGFDDPTLRTVLASDGALVDAGGDSATVLAGWLAKGDPRTRYEPRAIVIAEVVAVSPIPVISQMQAQYGDALGVVKYRLVSVESGDLVPGAEVLAVHWTVLARKFTQQSRFKPGDRHRLAVDDLQADHKDLLGLDFKNEWPNDEGTHWFVLEWSAIPAP